MVLTSAIRASFLSTLVLINYQVQLSFFCVYKRLWRTNKKSFHCRLFGLLFHPPTKSIFSRQLKKEPKKASAPRRLPFQKLYKRRTIRKVIGAGGRKIFEPQEFFFLTALIFFRINWQAWHWKTKKKRKLYSLWFTHTHQCYLESKSLVITELQWFYKGSYAPLFNMSMLSDWCSSFIVVLL